MSTHLGFVGRALMGRFGIHAYYGIETWMCENYCPVPIRIYASRFYAPSTALILCPYSPHFPFLCFAAPFSSLPVVLASVFFSAALLFAPSFSSAFIVSSLTSHSLF